MFSYYFSLFFMCFVLLIRHVGWFWNSVKIIQTVNLFIDNFVTNRAILKLVMTRIRSISEFIWMHRVHASHYTKIVFFLATLKFFWVRIRIFMCEAFWGEALKKWVRLFLGKALEYQQKSSPQNSHFQNS